MKRIVSAAILASAMVAPALPAVAQSPEQALALAIRQAACGNREVLGAQFTGSGVISVRCGTVQAAADGSSAAGAGPGTPGTPGAGAAGAGAAGTGAVTGFAPLLGGLGPALGLGFGAAVVAAAGGGSSTSDTQ